MSDSLIHRWSKRKADQEKPETHADKPVLDDEVEPDSQIEESAQEAATDGDSDTSEEEKEIPTIETLESIDEEGDFSAFLGPEVDETLQRLALRKMFKSPFYNVVDGLNDYDEDFTTFASLGDIVTSDMKWQEELKAEKEKQKLEEELKDTEQTEEIETLAAEEQETDKTAEDQANAELSKSDEGSTDDSDLNEEISENT